MADRPQLPPEVQPPEQPRDPRLLNPAFMAEAGKFIRSPVWADIKRAMLVRRPPAADVEDQPHVAAAKGFKGLALDGCPGRDRGTAVRGCGRRCYGQPSRRALLDTRD